MGNNLLNYKITEACFLLFGESYSHSVKFISLLSADAIKKAYWKKAKLYHPDRVLKDESSIKLGAMIFNRLTNAYKFLLEYKKTYIHGSIPSKAESREAKSDFKNYVHTRYVSDFYYQGRLPERTLRFGEYLFYSKIISWKTLIKAIIEQYRNRPRLGEICVKMGFLNESEVHEIIRNVKPGEKFGDTAQRLNYLSIYQSYAILGAQKKHNWLLGRYFTENNIISDEKIYEYFTLNKEHNFKIKKSRVSN